MNFKKILACLVLAITVVVPSVSSAMTIDQAVNTLKTLTLMLDISKSLEGGAIFSEVSPRPLTSSYVDWSDVNSDNKLDRKDLDYIYERIGRTSADIGYTEADINGDGVVDKEDFFKLRKYLHSIGDYVSAYDGPTIGPGWTTVPPDGVIDQNDVNAMRFAVALHAKDPVLFYSLYADHNEDGKIDNIDLDLSKKLLEKPPVIEEANVSPMSAGAEAEVITPAPQPEQPKQPEIKVSFPQGQLTAGTINTNLIVQTDLPSLCSYSQNSKDTYTQMKTFLVNGAGADKNISFQPLSNLPQNKQINYYVKCKSLEGAVMESNHIISFSVGNVAEGGYTDNYNFRQNTK
jgi:hypothetical protein